MGRKTRRSEKRRRKRLDRVLTLLEQANSDPKRRNRMTRKRELMNLVETHIRLFRGSKYERALSNANQT